MFLLTNHPCDILSWHQESKNQDEKKFTLVTYAKFLATIELKGETAMMNEKKYEMERKIADIDRKLLDFLSQKEILREKIEKNKSIILEFDKRVVEESYSLENDLQKKEKYDGEKLSLEESLDQVLNGLEDTEKNIQILINRKQNLETELESLRKDSTQNEEFMKENDNIKDKTFYHSSHLHHVKFILV